jgi:hypothetical protein
MHSKVKRVGDTENPDHRQWEWRHEGTRRRADTAVSSE